MLKNNEELIAFVKDEADTTYNVILTTDEAKRLIDAMLHNKSVTECFEYTLDTIVSGRNK